MQEDSQEASEADENGTGLPSGGIDETSFPVPNLTASENNQDPASGWFMLQLVLVLALVAFAIYGIVFLFKRISKPAQAKDPHLKVLAIVPLGTSSLAAVLSVGSKAWLVGGGDSGISLISEISEQEPLESMLIDEAKRTADLSLGRFPVFGALLQKLTGKKGRNNTAPGASGGNSFLDSHIDNLRGKRDRLKGL